ncbi:tRNA pseudouridine synthase Pus10 isoform X2 [Engystomops pustulosus]|uniref:tRNA pseudouridine synthase Pus10 isoform X2 n=1 Tax=Engystomops pustulosus TaxID=76066 RepID=UPI003AFABC6E
MFVPYSLPPVHATRTVRSVCPARAGVAGLCAAHTCIRAEHCPSAWVLLVDIAGPCISSSSWEFIRKSHEMLLIEEKYKSIAKLLLSSGTCPRCVLRFCCVGSSASYRLPYKNLADELQKFLSNDGDIAPPSKKVRLGDSEECRSETEITRDTDVNEAPQTCNLCLGILQHLCSTEFVKQIFHKVQSAGYEFQDFVFSVSLPPQLLVRESVFTRMAVVKALDKITDDDFVTHFPWPPSSPKTTCQVIDIQCNHASVFVAGRYNKYSRTLPQTPWVIDGERKMESSVEELITEQLMTVFQADSFNFSSSGREDVDVRTLGRGRPFAIELVNPHRVRVTEQVMKDLQQKINSTDKIKVRDLQIVTREAVAHMKEGEEEKTKCYSALIWTEKTIRKEDVEFLNDIKELKILQKTPLRVLHRRPLASRPRIIHTMKSEYMDEHHFRLYLKTQAGTYIKEFAHGDFGRTVPNIGSMMKTTADILELDVESVDVDWPPALED